MSEEKEIMVQEKVTAAKEIIIMNQGDYENAVKMLKDIKELREKLDKRHMPVKKKTYEAYRLAMDNINDYEKPLKEAERLIKGSMGQYVSKKEQKRREEEDRIRKDAEVKERARIKEDFKECGLDEKEAEQESEKMEVVVSDIKIEDETKVKDLFYRRNWYYKIVDATKIPREYMMPDEKKIGGVARTLKGAIIIPGVKIYSEKSPILR